MPPTTAPWNSAFDRRWQRRVQAIALSLIGLLGTLSLLALGHALSAPDEAGGPVLALGCSTCHEAVLSLVPEDRPER